MWQGSVTWTGLLQRNSLPFVLGRVVIYLPFPLRDTFALLDALVADLDTALDAALVRSALMKDHTPVPRIESVAPTAYRAPSNAVLMDQKIRTQGHQPLVTAHTVCRLLAHQESGFVRSPFFDVLIYRTHAVQRGAGGSARGARQGRRGARTGIVTDRESVRRSERRRAARSDARVEVSWPRRAPNEEALVGG